MGKKLSKEVPKASDSGSKDSVDEDEDNIK